MMMAYWSLVLVLSAICHTSVNFQLLPFISATYRERATQTLIHEGVCPVHQELLKEHLLQTNDTKTGEQFEVFSAKSTQYIGLKHHITPHVRHINEW